jgi:multiple sugar transport system permease protein
MSTSVRRTELPLTVRTPTHEPRNRRRRSSPGRAPATKLFLILPSVVILILTNAYPIAYAAFQALHNGSLISPGEFVGVDNFAKVLADPAFWRAAGFTAVFAVAGVFGSWIIGIAIALLLRTRIPAKGLLKTILLLPWVVPIVVSAMSWNWLIGTSSSPVPTIIHALGFGDAILLSDPLGAQITVCLFEIWVNFPFMMLMMSAALSSVDESIYEAAKIDGANARQQFRYMTLPIIAKPTYISWVLMAIFCVNDFPTVYLLTHGGPVGATNTLVVLAYKTVFQNFQTGPGVAIAFLMTLALAIVAVLLFRQIRKSTSL